MLRTMTRTISAGLLVGALALCAGVAFAQDAPAAKAPEPPVAERGGEDAPALPDDPKADRKAWAEALRAQWQEPAAGSARGGGVQMHFQGDSIYILYGTVLLQLSADTLELKAKVDLRELVLGERALGKKPRAEKAPKAEAEAAPAER